MTAPATERARSRRNDSEARALLLLAVVVVLDVIGLVMVLSASSVQALRIHGSSWHYFVRQLLFVAIGSGALVAAARIDYRAWRRFVLPLVGGSAFLLALVLVPGVGINVAGSSRWLGVGMLRVQPSELAKFALAVFVADLLARRADRIDDPRVTVRPVLAMFLVFVALMMLQPDMGTTLITGCVVFAILFVSGVDLRIMGKLVAGAAVTTFALAKLEPYRWRRMTAFLDPWADVGNTGYQAAQGLVALGTGGLFGIGLGESRAKFGFLPAAHTDFIFAVIGEEVGLVGTLLVVGLFVALAVLGAGTARRAPDRFGTYLAVGLTAWIIGQAAINIGAVVGLVPITGVPLPFVSAGGSSLVIAMTAVGILLNISRQGRAPRRRPAPARQPA